jgi:hypothetical protein
MNKTTTEKRVEARQEPFNKNPVMYQTWIDLLFLHWEVDPEKIKLTLPNGLYPDLYNRKCYAAITPFSVKNMHIPYFPSVPFLSNFNETYVRTYVINEEGTPGIWFYSLYADNSLAVEGAKRIPLPYKYAEINLKKNMGTFLYTISKLKNKSDTYEYIYIPSGEMFYPESESLEFFLIERYFLFYVDNKRKLKKIRVNHIPYPLQKVELMKFTPELLNLNNINIISEDLSNSVFSPGPVEVKIYFPEDA